MEDNKRCRCKRDCTTKLCGCRRKGRQCQEFCKCDGEVKCKNRVNEDAEKENIPPSRVNIRQNTAEKSKSQKSQKLLEADAKKFTFSTEHLVKHYFIHSGLRRHQMSILGLNKRLTFSDTDTGTDSD